MKNISLWYNSLPSRDQRMLQLISVVISFTLFYLLLWEPLFNAVDTEKALYKNQTEQLIWMQNAQKEVMQLRASGAQLSTQDANQSINALVERVAISTGIKAQIDSIKTDKSQNVKVNFKDVEFDRLTQWFGKLQNEYAIVPRHASISPTEKEGLVNCRVTLEKTTS